MTEDAAELLRRLWYAGMPINVMERLTGYPKTTLYSYALRSDWPSLHKVRREIAERIKAQHQNEVAFERMERARTARRIAVPMRAI